MSSCSKAGKSGCINPLQVTIRLEGEGGEKEVKAFVGNEECTTICFELPAQSIRRIEWVLEDPDPDATLVPRRLADFKTEIGSFLPIAHIENQNRKITALSFVAAEQQKIVYQMCVAQGGREFCSPGLNVRPKREEPLTIENDPEIASVDSSD